ncbi:MAG: DNA-processing protein DprA [Elusimicrobiota bacterium]
MSVEAELDDCLRLNALRQGRAVFDVGAEKEKARKLGVRLIPASDPLYPDLLRCVAGAPPILYCLGEPPTAKDTLAFVGSRRPTPYGCRMARRLAGEAVRAGFAVVSGLARGIDTESHTAALDAAGVTWAVLGSSLDRVYPPENDGLARRIAASGGCVLSELPFGSPPLPENFPKRNRIVSGLSWGTIVVEGRIRSGSLITARLAMDQGRAVFAVPGPIDSPLSEAPHLLIGEGAKLASSIADIVIDLPPGCQAASLAARSRRPSQKRPPLAQPQEKILELIGSGSATMEELALGMGLDLSGLSNILLELELQGLIFAVPGQRYAKKAS